MRKSDLEKSHLYQFEEIEPTFTDMTEEGYAVDGDEVNFMKEFKANNLMNQLMVFLKTQPQFEVWWFTTLGHDHRRRIMTEMQRLLLRFLA